MKTGSTSQHNHSPHLFVDSQPIDLAHAFLSRLRGRSVFVCGLSAKGQRTRDICQRLGLRTFDLASFPNLVWTDESYDESARKFCSLVASWEQSEPWRNLVEKHLPLDFDRATLRVHILQQASTSYLPASAICVFVRSHGVRCIIYARDPWLRLVLQGMRNDGLLMTLKGGCLGTYVSLAEKILRAVKRLSLIHI